MTRRACRTRQLIAIAAVVLAAARCGGAPAGSPAADAQAKTARNACALVDREDMERLVKGKVTMLHNIESADQTNCEVYREGDSSRPVFTLEAHWAGGRTMVQSDRGAATLARRIMNDKNVDLSALTGSASVKGVADDAFYSPGMPAWVLKDDVLLKFIAPEIGIDEMQTSFVALATKALSKLP